MDRYGVIDGWVSEDWREIGVGGSSLEDKSASFRHSTPSCNPLRDTWLGQKHLESMIALQLHLQADPEDAVPSIEVCNFQLSASASWYSLAQSTDAQSVKTEGKLARLPIQSMLCISARERRQQELRSE